MIICMGCSGELIRFMAVFPHIMIQCIYIYYIYIHSPMYIGYNDTMRKYHQLYDMGVYQNIGFATH